MDYLEKLKILVNRHDFDSLRTGIDYVEEIEKKQNEIREIENKLSILLDESCDKAKLLLRSQPNVYFCERRLVGMNLSNEKISDHYISEEEMRKNGLDFNTGDYIEVSDDKKVNVVDHESKEEGEKIVCYKQVRVDYDKDLNCKIIKYYANGDKVMYHDYPFVITVNPDAKVAVGDIIDYAFYRHQGLPFPQCARKGSVRWIYPPEELIEKTEKVKPKKEKKDNYNIQNEAEHKDLDLNLNGQTVLILSDKAHSKKLENVVYNYNGVPTIVGGSQSNEKIPPMFEKMILSYDIVIICTDYLHHSVSQTAINVLKKKKEKDDAKYAVSNSSSEVFIEHALYRAENHLPAYEVSGEENIEYPVRN